MFLQAVHKNEEIFFQYLKISLPFSEEVAHITDKWLTVKG
jgi:hypothetical protein